MTTFPFFSTVMALLAILVALGFAGRVGLGVIRGERSRASGVLALALTLTAGLELLDMLALIIPEQIQFWRAGGLLTEGALGAAWVWATVLFARDYEDGSLPWTQRSLLALALVMPPWSAYLVWVGAYYTPDFVTEQLLFLLPGGFYFYIGFTLCCVAALFNIEATLASAVHHWRWKIKFVLLGAATIIAAVLLYASQGLLYRTIDMTLAPLRALALLLGASMMWFSDLRRGPEVSISFSRRMAFKSVVLVVAGLYLVGLGLAGEGARLFGDELGRIILLGLAFVAGLVLLILFLSETFRRKLRLFVQLHFYGEKYDYRLQWVAFTDKLVAARTQDELQQAALAACCQTFGLVGATLFLFDHSQRVYAAVSRVEMDPCDDVFAESSALVNQLMAKRSVIRVAEAGESSAWLKAARFVVPVFREDNLDGFMLFGPPINPREEYDEEDFELMNTMARHISSALLNMRLLDQLARSREMEVMGKVSAFVLHDLKNHVYTLSLMADNARKFIGNPEFQKDLVDSLGSTVGKMKILISQLKGLPDRQTLKRSPVGLLDVARESTRLLRQDRLHFEGENVTALVDAEEMGKVVLNLCLNALDASPENSGIRIMAGFDVAPFFRVVDQGHGISEDFIRNGLFEPFKSTKAKGMGIGLYQCKQIVEAHGGRIDVASSPGQGATFTVWLTGVGAA